MIQHLNLLPQSRFSLPNFSVFVDGSDPWMIAVDTLGPTAVFGITIVVTE